MLIEINQSKPLRALLVGVPTPDVSDLENQESLQELSKLVKTLGYQVAGTTFQRRQSLFGAIPLGDGKLQEIAKMTNGSGVIKSRTKKMKQNKDDPTSQQNNEAQDEELEDDDKTDSSKIDAVIVDCELTPSQIVNLKTAFNVEVYDRTGVIVAIFSKHAKTREARLQVEIARLKYLAPRIRESGNNERQGVGRGSGESNIELDKRRIRDRIAELKKEIALIQKEQGIKRKKRNEVECVALVGYTNAGKSSLMRSLTGAENLVADKLFATLDTTVRALYPETRPQILITDTVGFIRKLPHDLVVSFHSTLEEALNASLLLFVIDASDENWRNHLLVTQSTLTSIGVTQDYPNQIVFNKVDLITEEKRISLKQEYPTALFLSAHIDADIKKLREFLIEFFERDMVDEKLFIPYSIQGVIGHIRETLRVIHEQYDNSGLVCTVRGKLENIKKVRKRYGI
ncbi:GTPase HflX [Spirobacillus cienkowskii]|jgi:GTP-binding protein HflX|uniref:GTPase HflX n=1 Tax=Spirobacillus cienkowskii TaxID=495820 RepID=A0A369L170_9BACT|nr:MAG: GTPase HflX [Spirobacillus cienkowskii]